MYIHIVTPTDTPETVARQYGISTERLVSDNGISDLSRLVPGQALLILRPQIIYTAKRGDTLFSIARQYGISAMELLQRNPVYLFQQLYPGDQLTISFQGAGNRKINSYGFSYPNVPEPILKRALPCLTRGAVFSYGFQKDGSLRPIPDQAIIDTLYTYKTAPILVFSSLNEKGSFDSERASFLLRNKALWQTVIDNLLQTMRAKGYLGLDIDFEYIPASDGAAYSAFIYQTATALHRYGYSVNVDLAPKTSSQQQGILYEGLDYAAIGEAADTVLLMTYEWGYAAGEPRAIAPLPQVRQVVQYAVSQIKREKIYLGIPNYGYDWPVRAKKSIGQAKSLGNEEAVRLAAATNAQIHYDQQAEAPYFEYRANDGQEHLVWFEDVRSIQKKFRLMDEFQLRGPGYWNLSRPFAQNWSLLSYDYVINKEVPW